MASILLPALFASALSSASQAFNQSSIAPETQDLVRSTLADLRELASRIASLALFSPNETLEDISTRDLVYLFAPYVDAEVHNRVRTAGPGERLDRLRLAQNAFHSFIANLQTYEIVPAAERELHEKPSASVKDPAKRRELKIQQYRKEKELRAQIETLRKRRSQLPSSEPTTDFDLIASLLPSGANSQPSEDDEPDADTDELLRDATLLLLRLTFAQAYAHLESMNQELELLRSAPFLPPMPAPPPEDGQRGRAKEDEDMWRLDRPAASGGPDGRGPLMDSGGKPLRPFTILPAGESTDRARLQGQVFGPGHRLPTMSIDEYLEIERERGNILTGGGPQSESAPTTSEQLALDAEMDGSAFGAERAEDKRRKDEEWARYTEANPRGAGNTMNRG